MFFDAKHQCAHFSLRLLWFASIGTHSCRHALSLHVICYQLGPFLSNLLQATSNRNVQIWKSGKVQETNESFTTTDNNLVVNRKSEVEPLHWTSQSTPVQYTDGNLRKCPYNKIESISSKICNPIRYRPGKLGGQVITLPAIHSSRTNGEWVGILLAPVAPNVSVAYLQAAEVQKVKTKGEPPTKTPQKTKKMRLRNRVWSANSLLQGWLLIGPERRSSAVSPSFSELAKELRRFRFDLGHNNPTDTRAGYQSTRIHSSSEHAGFYSAKENRKHHRYHIAPQADAVQI